MRTVEMRLQPSELSGAMAEMRVWLDEHRFEPSSFCCREEQPGVIVRVNFKVSGEAEAFASRFSGRIGGDAAVGDGQDFVLDISTVLSPEGVVG